MSVGWTTGCGIMEHNRSCFGRNPPYRELRHSIIERFSGVIPQGLMYTHLSNRTHEYNIIVATLDMAFPAVGLHVYMHMYM